MLREGYKWVPSAMAATLPLVIAFVSQLYSPPVSSFWPFALVVFFRLSSFSSVSSTSKYKKRFLLRGFRFDWAKLYYCVDEERGPGGNDDDGGEEEVDAEIDMTTTAGRR
eukprot:7048872-Pyramimonas_sp.AAC.1